MKTKKSKSYWNYRILYDEAHDTYAIYEVFYSKNKPNGYTGTPADISTYETETPLSNFKWILKKIKHALKKPILFYGEKFPKKVKQKHLNLKTK